MSFSALLIHRAEVFRRGESRDAFGQLVDANPSLTDPEATPTVTFRCRLSGGSGGRTNQERSTDVFEVTYTMFAEADADVREDDAVRVLDGSGNVILPYSKVKLKNDQANSVRSHHLEVDLVVQRGPQ